MNREDAVQNAKTLTELAESYKELCNGIKGTSRETAEREGKCFGPAKVAL